MTVLGAAGRVLDAALDRSVLAGYSRIGYRVRERMGWPGAGRTDLDGSGALAGSTVAVTGAAGGLGRAAAVSMAGLGADLVLLVRDPDRAEPARRQIRDAAPDATVRVERCDLADLNEVRAVAERLRGDRVDVLVHNAGVLPARRSVTPQGHELTLATHVLGPLLLSELLRPALTGGRVIWVSSGGMYTQALPADDPEYLASPYRGATAYARTKRMQVALTPLLARRWAGDRIGVHSMHPGWADTPGVATSLPGFHRLIGPVLRTPDEGADTVVWLAAADPPPPTGLFWHDRAPRPAHYLPLTRHSEDALDRLWRYCATSIGVDPDRFG